MKSLNTQDPQIGNLISLEKESQKNQLNFIASENIAYNGVKEALGSILTDIYAEGYAGKRYYAGCKQVDKIEQLAINRCKELFGTDHANVQPHSGTQANMAVFYACLDPGDTIMGMSLAAGGHLTHGHTVNFSGKLYKSVQYCVDPISERIDYDALSQLAQQNRPKLIIAGGSAYSRTMDIEKIQQIAHSIGAYLLVDIAHTSGLIVANIYPNPTPYADFITGTTHKMLRGPRGGFILCKKEHQERIDRAVFPGIQGGPALNNIAAKAVAFHLALQPAYKNYIKQAVANAHIMARTFEKKAYRIVSGGTDTHLFVVDLSKKGLTGRSAEKILEKNNILVSRSAIPFDTQKPLIASGIRLGTLAETTKGLTEENASAAVEKIDKILCSLESTPC